MRIIGHFNNINNNKTYWVKIGETGTIKYIQDSLDDLNEQAICWSTTPVTISSDVSDTFENVFIRSCEINLVTNFSIKDYVVADNYMDIPVEIRYDDENGEIIFSGCVVPLQYNQPFANEWNEINIECVDKLGILDYIKLRPLLQSLDYTSPRDIIDTIIGLESDLSTNNAVKFQSKVYNINYDHTQDTLINPKIFIGESEDDWMTCKEALEEIGKIYGCYFYQNGDTCIIENIMLYNLNNPVTITENDYSADDTNITIQEAYNRIECTVDLSTLDETLIDPFSDENMVPLTDRRERVLTELIVKQDGDFQDQIDFSRHILLATDPNSPVIDWSRVQFYSSESELDVYDTYCQVMENKFFNFDLPNYIVDGLGNQGKDAWKTLEWLWQHPGKGAFLSYGTTEDIQNPSNNSVVKQPQMHNCLFIQVNGNRTYNDLQDPNYFDNQIYNNVPVCSFHLDQSNNIVPTDRSATNYLVISGKITLNPITPRTDYLGFDNISRSKWKDFYDIDEDEYTDAWLAWRLSRCSIMELRSWIINDLPGTPTLQMYQDYNHLLYNRVVKNKEDDDGVFYQRYSWNNTPEGFDPVSGRLYELWPYNQEPVYFRDMLLPPLAPKFEKFKYEGSMYEGKNPVPIDNVFKLSVLACELKIGNKYLVEDLDMLQQNNPGMSMANYGMTYRWLTEEECPIRDGVRQTWFTIGIDPSIDKSILGTEWDIQNTSSIDKAITQTGLAIPIYSSSGLVGPIDFKILGPYNLSWAHNYKVSHGWAFWKHYHPGSTDVPILAFVENIIIKDFKISLCQSNKSQNSANTDNDIVYYSYENNRYQESKDYDCKFCTSLTTSDVERLGIKYEPNNSAIMYTNPISGGIEAWTGMSYKGSSGVKLEEARVAEHYNIWKRPRNIVETTLKLINPENAYIKTNYRFNYLKNSDNTYQIYKILGREIDLKKDTMQCQMKELSN